MQPTASTLSNEFRARQLWLTLAVSCVLMLIALAPAHAVEATTIARTPPARDAARPETDNEQRTPDKKAGDDGLICFPRGFEREPLRELLDKYAPSAVEWSMLLKVAEASQRRDATP